MYHTAWFSYHISRNGFITQGIYHIDFWKSENNRVITQLKIWLGLKTPDGKRLFKKNKKKYEDPIKKDLQYAKYNPFSI